MSLPKDYEERVYAGVLGKIIGVYLGRPFEGWTHERIMAELGEITGYVHDRVGVPLIVTDDDITGTFTFYRALEDSGYDAEVSAEAIGRGWLNYIIEDRTILWWGGMGNSTEHTAYLRMKSGIPAPHSGSMALNTATVAEQIGAQIFIDAWAMVAPGDPERAATFARRAASVSHDGEAVHAAVLLAAMEAQAFVEPQLDRLLDVGLSLIPRDSVIARMAGDLRDWRVGEPDWHVARERFVERYGYHRYGGNVHVVPNHGLILLSLLWGEDDFSRTMTIVNTVGWDTDCNSGNAGCLMGIKNGLAGLGGSVDWRGPVADRIYLPTAEGGRAITDAVIEAGRIAAAGRILAGEAPVLQKDGARFHFAFAGAVQGFSAVSTSRGAPASVENVVSSGAAGERSLRIAFDHAAGGFTRASTPTFIPPDAVDMPGYRLLASPTLHPGQEVRATVRLADGSTGPVDVRLVLGHYDGHDRVVHMHGPSITLASGKDATLVWLVPDVGGQPIAEVGVEITGSATGALHLDRLTWVGSPTVRLGRPADGGGLWRRAWVDAVDVWPAHWPEAYRISQNRGTGMISQGSLEWTDYRVDADITSRMAAGAGIAARVRGLRRYYALVLTDGGAVLLVRQVDDQRTVLAEAIGGWESFQTHALGLEVAGARVSAWIDGVPIGSVVDLEGDALASGAVGLVCESGTMACDEVRVSALMPTAIGATPAP